MSTRTIRTTKDLGGTEGEIVLIEYTGKPTHPPTHPPTHLPTG